jgi:hypothetical protein
MILTIVVIVLCVYFPKLRYAIFEGDRRYGTTEDSEDVQTVSAGTESKVQ